MSGRARAGRVKWRSLASWLGLALAAACNALTGVNELQFADARRAEVAPDGAAEVAPDGAADAGADAAPATVIGSLQGSCNEQRDGGCPEEQAGQGAGAGV